MLYQKLNQRLVRHHMVTYGLDAFQLQKEYMHIIEDLLVLVALTLALQIYCNSALIPSYSSFPLRSCNTASAEEI